jgi:hypothetical protein
MFHHLISKMEGKGKRKQDEGSSSSSQAQSDMSASLFVVIVLFFLYFYLHLIISIHCYVLFEMSNVFTYRAQWHLSSDRSSFLGCCTARKRLT